MTPQRRVTIQANVYLSQLVRMAKNQPERTVVIRRSHVTRVERIRRARDYEAIHAFDRYE